MPENTVIPVFVQKNTYATKQVFDSVGKGMVHSNPYIILRISQYIINFIFYYKIPEVPPQAWL